MIGGTQKAIIKRLFNRNFSRDFGIGFYLVLDKDTPDRTAHNTSLRKHFNMRCFYKQDEEWVDFVLSNRFQEKFEHLNDLIFGPKTTDITYNYLRKYRNGELTKSDLLTELSFEKITYQYAYCTDNSTKTLQILISDLNAKNEVFLPKAIDVKWANPSMIEPKGERRVDLEEDKYSRRNLRELKDIRHIVKIVETLARMTKNKQKEIVRVVGKEFFTEQLSMICISRFLDVESIAEDLIATYDIREGNFDYTKEFNNLPSIELVADYMAAVIDGLDETQRGQDNLLMYKFFCSPIFDIIYNYDNHLYYLCDKYIITCFKENKILYNGEKKLKYKIR